MHQGKKYETKSALVRPLAETPLHSCEALAEQIKSLAVSLFTPIDIEELEALARKHVYCWLRILCAGICAACNTYALRVAAFMRDGKKLSYSNFIAT
ncbi:MAG: hypothetical protein KF775_18680 [Cyclobacteriaceae bacterium]|nr:hypothetical protein [Cyclobacteriaceae bacterium]